MRAIAAHVWSVPGLWLGRVYLIRDPDGLTLIDTGLPFAADRIAGQLAALGWPATTVVQRILVTHAHPDHAGGLARLQTLTGAQVIASAADRPVLEGRAPVPHRPGAAAPRLARRLGWSGRLPAAHVDRVVGEGDVLPDVLGGVRVLATPGHTPGHLAFWQPQRGILFCGDVLVNGRGLHLPSPTWTVDMALNIRSLARLAALGARLVCTGHGPPLGRDAARRMRALATRAQISPRS